MSTAVKRITPAEWRARQSQLPPAARLILDSLKEHQAAEQLAAVHRKMREDRMWNRHKARFEDAISGELVREGAYWLNGYRIPDTMAFAIETDQFYAAFDPRAVGCWTIRLTLGYFRHIGEGKDCREWLPISLPWSVCRPDGLFYFPDFPSALAHATAYVASAA